MVQCDNCERIEDEWWPLWECPECEDLICCGSDFGCRQHEKLRPTRTATGWQGMMVCADCCDSTCWCEAECDDCGDPAHSCSCDDDDDDDDYCDDCGEEWDDCECDDDDDDD